MLQATFRVDEAQMDFLKRHRQYGFKDRSAMVRMALSHLQAEVEQDRLRQSAELYAELYADDAETQALTATAMGGWPE